MILEADRADDGAGIRARAAIVRESIRRILVVTAKVIALAAAASKQVIAVAASSIREVVDECGLVILGARTRWSRWPGVPIRSAVLRGRIAAPPLIVRRACPSGCVAKVVIVKDALAIKGVARHG